MSELLSWSLQPEASTSLTDEELAVFRPLVQQWQRKRSRNTLRRRYYDSRNTLRDLGISIPPSLKSVDTVVGWPAKAVDVLANRVRFDGFVTTGADTDPLGLDSVLRANDFRVELAQAIRSMFVHSCAFVTVAHGDEDAGEPPALVTFRSAELATGLWDFRERRLSAALEITDVDAKRLADSGELIPTAITLWLPDRAVLMSANGSSWTTERRDHGFDHVPVHVLRNHPDLDRPFGRSRVSRPVMALTDAAVRTMLRIEVSAEFFTSPQRFVLGANEDTFTDASGNAVPKWSAVIGRILAISKDEDGDTPTVGQFTQMTMQPHSEMLRTLAARFSGETGIPMSSLGVMTDSGPSSSDAIFAAQEDLVIEAENVIDGISETLCDVARDVLVARGEDPSTDEAQALQAAFRRPDRPSQASMADAALKQIQAVPWLGDSQVMLEQMGFTTSQIRRLVSDKRRAQSGDLISQLLGGSGDNSGGRGQAGAGSGATVGAGTAGGATSVGDAGSVGS